MTPFASLRLYAGVDFGPAVEPYFNHQLKHHPMFLQAHLHAFYLVNLLVLGLRKRGQRIPHVVLQYHHLLYYAMAGAFTYL